MHGGSNVAGDAASKTFVAEEGTVKFEMTVVIMKIKKSGIYSTRNIRIGLRVAHDRTV